MPTSDDPILDHFYNLAEELRPIYRGDNGNASVYVGTVDRLCEAVDCMNKGMPWGYAESIRFPEILPDLRAIFTQCSSENGVNGNVQKLTHCLKNFPRLEYLNISHSGMDDKGLEILAGHLVSSGVKTLVLADNPRVTQAGRDAIKQSLSRVPHEVFVSWANENGSGPATFKEKDGNFYDMVIKSEGADAIVEFAVGATGISGVSAGDTCPPSVRDQIGACLGGGIAATTANLETCLKSGGSKGKLALCAGKAFLTGCTALVAATAGRQCVSGSEYEGGESGGWDVDATPLSGVTHSTDIDWDHWGDLGTMGFNGFYS